MKNNNKKISTKSGSVLIFSLFIMMISLVIGVSLMTTSMIGKKSTSSTAKSVNSFQVADSGIEYAYQTIREYRWSVAGHDLLSNTTHVLNNVFPSGQCANGVVTGTANGGEYKLYFFTTVASTTPISTCSSTTAAIVNIRKIKSVGSYNGITRSVEANVDLSTL